jgi:hypothetical protein
MAEQKVPPPEMTVTIVSAGKPIKVLNYNQSPYVFKSLGGGYYVNESYPKTYILVINELPVIPENYPLLIFASRKVTFRQALQQILADGAYSYISYAYIVRPKLTHEVLTMAGVMSMPKENLEFIMQDIGEDLAKLNPDLMLDNISVEYQLGRMSLEDRFVGLDVEDRRKMFQMLRDEGFG